jgi:hypothetical protein
MLMILFAVASSVTAVLLALALWIAPQIGLSPGLWALPVATFVGFVGVFFLVRGYVLPPHLAAPAWKATATLTLWIVVTLAIWQAAMWVVRPIMRSAGFERGTFVILLACLLATLVVIERALGGARRLPR